MRLNSIVISIVAAALVSFLGAGVASADFAIAGEWYENRGPTVNIPPGAFDGPCGTATTVDVPFAQPVPASLRAPGPCVRHQQPLAAGNTSTNISGVLGLPQFGIPAAGQVVVAATTAGAAVVPNATVRIPSSVFGRALSSQIPVPANPVVQQLDTTFIFKGPAPLRGVSANSAGNQAVGIASQTRLMQKNAWNGAGQAGRLAADFNQTRTDTALGVTRRATYTTKGNKFGGTMGLLLKGIGNVYVVTQIIPGGGKEMILSPLGSPGGPYNWVHMGKGYNSTQVRAGQPAPFFVNYALTTRAWTPTTSMGNPGNGNTTTAGGPFPNDCTGTFPPAPVPCGLIAGFSGTAGSIPPGTTMNTGFPWTTGHVSAYGKGIVGGVPQTSTLTAEGSDTASGGVRTIQLVSAGFALRNNPATGLGRTPHVDTVTIQLPEPGSTMALMGALGLIGGLYGVRRKLF